jgi:ABC-type transport system involved in multi-copper enzyme maturation permease subunit
MDAPAPAKVVKINRWLPYLAVFQSDVRQTQRSWVYRIWVLASVLAAVGYLLFHIGVHQKAQMVQLASTVLSDLLLWVVMGSVTLIAVLTASSISAERGTVADSVLSRGISRYQYFLAKWHARLATVIGTFLVMGIAALLGSYFFLQEDLSLGGSVVALLTVAVLLLTVTTLGVTFSAVADSTLMGITLLWIILYGIGFLLTLLPDRFPSPYRMLTNLPFILRGQYSLHELGQLTTWCLVLSLVAACVGLAYFSRRDV